MSPNRFSVLALKLLLLVAVFVCLGCGTREDAMGLESSQIKWSDRPGCNERHLQRRYRSPIFEPERRIVTQEDVLTAREIDSDAFAALQMDFLKLALELPENFPYQDFGKWRERIDVLRYRCVEVGGDVAEMESSISDMRLTLITAWRMMFEGNSEALKKMDEAEQFHNRGEWRLMDRDVAQMSACMPTQDAIPTILTFDNETFALLLSDLKSDTKSWPVIRATLLKIGEEAQSRAPEFHTLDERLEMIRSN